jgi:hypothetical protein
MYYEGQTPDYETAALPAELRRQVRPNITLWQRRGNNTPRVGTVSYSCSRS